MIQYSVYYPGGNTTALVKKKIQNTKLKKIINDKIMYSNPSIEQVGFIWSKKNKYYLEMAGGEFCANATRSAMYEILRNETGTNISIIIPTINGSLKGGLDNKDVWTEVPSSPTKPLKEIRGDYFVVNFNGISQIVVPTKKRITNVSILKNRAKRILSETNLLSEKKASGVMFLTNTNQYILDPVVWVRDIQTFFYETSCGTGTAAVGLFLNKPNVKIEVLQPSGKKLIVKTDCDSKTIVSGEVSVLSENITLEL